MIEQSDTIELLAAALVEFRGKVSNISKASENPFFHSKYASLSDILNAIQAPLSEAGLAVVQMPTSQNMLATQIIHKSGQWMRSEYAMNVKEANNPQALGSAITYSRRYALAAALCLNIDEDDDGNAASAPKTAPVVPRNSPAPRREPEPINYTGQDDDPQYAGSRPATLENFGIIDGPGVGDWGNSVTLTVTAIRKGVAKSGANIGQPWEKVTTEELGELWNNTKPLRPMQEGMYGAIVDGERIIDWKL